MGKYLGAIQRRILPLDPNDSSQAEILGSLRVKGFLYSAACREVLHFPSQAGDSIPTTEYQNCHDLLFTMLYCSTGL